MQNDLSVRNEANNLVEIVKNFWGQNVSEIKIENLTDVPYELFVLTMKLYNYYHILMEYDRSTLSIKVKTENEYITLSRLTNQKVFRGFESYELKNLLHNFKVLDHILHNQ